MIYHGLFIFFLKTTHYDESLMNAHMLKFPDQRERRFRNEH